MKQIKNFINGEFVAGGPTFDKRSPLDGAVIAQVAEAGKAEVDAAVKAAQAALHGPWGQLAVADRVELLYGVAERNQPPLRRLPASRGGRHRQADESWRAISTFRAAPPTSRFSPTSSRTCRPNSSKWPRPTAVARSTTPAARPVGVVGVICPWNLPLLLMTWKVGPALACGNTVVVKPSEETPQTATLLGEVMNAVGIPRGVYNVVHGFGPDSAGEFLTTPPGRQRHHLHRRNPHRRGDHEGRRRRRAPGLAGNGRQESRRSSSPTATSTPPSKARCARSSPTAARSASAPSASTSSARCSTSSSPR